MNDLQMQQTKEMILPKGTWSWILKMLQQQGLSFVLLAVAVYFLNAKLDKVEAENRALRKEMVTMLQGVIKDNTEALTKIEDLINR
ncbi:MAG: hypothetical protein AAF901_12630 [Bacteroidota bacterium]